MRKFGTGLIAGLLVLAAAACGGSDGERATREADAVEADDKSVDADTDEDADVEEVAFELGCGGDDDEDVYEEDSYEDEYEDDAEALRFAADADDDEEYEEESEDEPLEISDETLAELQAITDDAVAIIEAFWRANWSACFPGEYESPTVYGGYFGLDSPPCGGETDDDSYNAFYCFDEDFVAWDWQLFAAYYDDDVIGDAMIYYVLAHEWGHVIQGRMDEDTMSIAAELQADCLAGATITGAIEQGLMEYEDGDRGEIFQTLASFGDEVEWADEESHGSADERIEAYQLGEYGGIGECLTL